MAKTFFPGPKGTQQKHTIPREDLRDSLMGEASAVGTWRQDTAQLYWKPAARGGTGRAVPCWPEGRWSGQDKGKNPVVGRNPTSSGTTNEAGTMGASEHSGLGHSMRAGTQDGARGMGCHCRAQWPEPEPLASSPAALSPVLGAQGPDTCLHQ